MQQLLLGELGAHYKLSQASIGSSRKMMQWSSTRQLLLHVRPFVSATPQVGGGHNAADVR